MKNCLLAAIVLLLSLKMNAQGGQQMPEGTLYGKIIDSATGKPIEYASVQLIVKKMDTATKKMVEVTAGGALTSGNGEFRVEHLPAMGQYMLQVTGMGYKMHTRKFAFIDMSKMKQGGARDMNALLGALDKDLGNIKLQVDNQVLEGVVVQSTTSAAKMAIDRKVYTVDKDLTAAGGNAADVMKNIPAINVDIDGNISIRNSSPQIFVDGRPTNLTLDQIPADQIETVEVITNPSAKYDASAGNAGIVNIVLKKTKRIGYSGNIRAGIDQRGKLNGGFNTNLRQGKFNVFVNGNVGQRKSIAEGTTERNTFMRDTTINLLQRDKNINEGLFMFGRAGVDYFLSNRSTISLSGVAVRGNFKNNSTSNIGVDTIRPSATTSADIFRNSFSDGNFRNLGGTIGFVHNFPKTGHQYTADATYNNSKSKNENNINNSNSNNSQDALFGTFRQFQQSNTRTERLTVQTDYANPISDKSKIEFGARLNQTKMNSVADYFNQIGSSMIWQKQYPLSTNFNYTDRVWAAYANYTGKAGENFGYQLGLRAENSGYDGVVTRNVVSTNAVTGYKDSTMNFSIDYPISLFPSVFLSQKLKAGQELQLNYTRKINRPGFFQLFPFIDYSDVLNLSRGNEQLKPEFVNSFELSYSKEFNRSNTFIASLYYKHTTDLITRYQSQEANPENSLDTLLINTYTNANSSYVTGLELITKNTITKWWDLTGNLNFYTSKINIDDPGIPTADQMVSWFGKLTNNFKLYKNLSLQISGDYNSKTVLAAGGRGTGDGGGRGGGFMGGSVSGNAQGYSMPSYGVDAALKYDFLKGNAASISLSVNDIFKTKVNELYTSSPYFNQHATRFRDQQFFRLNFSWRFGKFDTSLFKRKNNKAEQESMSGGMQGMQ